MTKRILSLLLVLALLCAALPQLALPARAEVISSGSCGKHLTWTLDDTGTLTISGTGNMENYETASYSHSSPWKDLYDNITKIVVEEGVTSVGNGAFCGATKAVSIHLPSTLNKIGIAACGSCYDLTEVSIPLGVTQIPDSAFDYCLSLEEIALHDGITLIGKNAFENCPLKHIQLPPHLTVIGSGAFSSTDLTEVVVPDGVSSLESFAFSHCKSLAKVTLPDSVESLDSYAFSSDSALTEIRLPQGLQSIPDHCFSECVSLEHVDLPASLKTIEASAFRGCSRLWSIELPLGLQKIDSYAFRECRWLLGVKLPASVTEIGCAVFADCPKLMGAVVLNPDVSYNKLFDEEFIFNSADTTYLYGTVGSTTHTYANDYGYTFYSWPDHTHEYFETTLEPSCTAGGYQVQVCDCGEIAHAEPLHALGHKYRDGKCVRCGAYAPVTWSDVSEGAYYYDPVMWAVDNGITGGTGDGVFSPKKVCTREQVVTFLWKAAGSPEPNGTVSPFTDVTPNKYYFKPVLWAVENKITSGATETSFGVKKSCTREQVVSFLWKAAGSPQPESMASPFTDVVPGKYYFKPVLWANENGVTGGVGDGLFGVGRTCTRAQVVTFLYKAYTD